MISPALQARLEAAATRRREALAAERTARLRAIPARVPSWRARSAQIVELHRHGAGLGVIARAIDLSERHTRRVLATLEREGALRTGSAERGTTEEQLDRVADLLLGLTGAQALWLYRHGRLESRDAALVAPYAQALDVLARPATLGRAGATTLGA